MSSRDPVVRMHTTPSTLINTVYYFRYLSFVLGTSKTPARTFRDSEKNKFQQKRQISKHITASLCNLNKHYVPALN